MKIKDLQDKGVLHGAVLPTEIDGLFVRNLSLNEIGKLQKQFAEVENGKDEEASLMAMAGGLVDIARDSEGNLFDDMQTKEAAVAFGFGTLVQMMQACLNAFTMGNELGET